MFLAILFYENCLHHSVATVYFRVTVNLFLKSFYYLTEEESNMMRTVYDLGYVVHCFMRLMYWILPPHAAFKQYNLLQLLSLNLNVLSSDPDHTV